MSGLPKHDMIAIIPRGTIVYSTAPDWPNEGKPAGRRLFKDRYRKGEYGDPEYDQLTWSGSGGYWRWVRLRDVEWSAGTGICQCGCGQATEPYKWGPKKGHPRPYVEYHDRATLTHTVEDRGYTTPCWIWPVGEEGDYGRAHRDGKTRQMHRWYYERANGPIPDGLHIDHLCRVPACVNPEHLEAVTPGENVRRGDLARLTQADVAAIRRALSDALEADGVTTMGTPRKYSPPGLVQRLSAQYGVCDQTIRNIWNGSRWQDGARVGKK